MSLRIFALLSLSFVVRSTIEKYPDVGQLSVADADKCPGRSICSDGTNGVPFVPNQIHGCRGSFTGGLLPPTSTAERLCCYGWHVCENVQEVKALGLTPNICEQKTNNKREFFASKQRSLQLRQCSATGTNDVFGCGDIRGMNPFLFPLAPVCSPFNAGTAHLFNGGLQYGWSVVGSNGIDELTKCQKRVPYGGVLCCRRRPPTPRPVWTGSPTPRPIWTASPTPRPTWRSVSPTRRPSSWPTPRPTRRPSWSPSPRPTWKPTLDPSQSPTKRPTWRPTPRPTWSPSPGPTWRPTPRPTWKPTRGPSQSPTIRPTWRPTWNPSQGPSQRPSWSPSPRPTPRPTWRPSWSPTPKPTWKPTSQSPTPRPTWQTGSPTPRPVWTRSPTTPRPTKRPSWAPSQSPTPRPTWRTGSPTPRPTWATGSPTRRPTWGTGAPTRRSTWAQTPTRRPITKPPTRCCETKEYTCCRGQKLVYPEKCCNGEPYDSRKLTCCDGKIVEAKPKKMCCDGEWFDANPAFKCCNGKELYNPLKQKCCDDGVQNL